MITVNWFKNILNINNPKCLYCNYKLVKGKTIFAQTNFYCKMCEESFAYWGTGFNFSCNNILIAYNKIFDNYPLVGGGYVIRRLYPTTTNWIKVTNFKPDFSDKDKLYNKLRMLLVFS